MLPPPTHTNCAACGRPIPVHKALLDEQGRWICGSCAVDTDFTMAHPKLRPDDT